MYVKFRLNKNNLMTVIDQLIILIVFNFADAFRKYCTDN